MIIGERSKFAIEFELENEYRGTWLYGKFCYWIQNKRIGDYELVTSLRDVLFQMIYIVGDCSKRFHDELFELDVFDLYNRLNDALFGNGESEYEMASKEQSWARFNVAIPVDVFDQWKVFLVERQDISRFIIKDLNGVEVYEVLLKDSHFDKVIAEIYGELNKLYELEVENERLQTNLSPN